MANETQRELIETEMAGLIGELQQLKGVRESLAEQKERKTVGDYLANGNVIGRYFERGKSISVSNSFARFITEDEPRKGRHYRITELRPNGFYFWAEIKFSGRTPERISLGDIFSDIETPINSEESQ